MSGGAYILHRYLRPVHDIADPTLASLPLGLVPSVFSAIKN